MIAAALLADAEERLSAVGVKIGWLACAIGNGRAVRCYEKSGWCCVGSMVSKLTTPNEFLPLEVWRYERKLE